MESKKPDKKPASNVTTGEGQCTTYYGDDNKPILEVVEKRTGQIIIRKPGR
jgi:hypothetical protein